jgi:hypothetical protein
MLTRAYRTGVLAIAIGIFACTSRAGPIAIEERTLVLRNDTSRDWKNVRVTVNDHFVGGLPVLVAGGRMNAPLSQFQTGFGQHYDPSNQVVYKVEVTATDAKGESVNLRWGHDRTR